MKPIGVPKTITLEESESIKRYLNEIKGYRTLSRSEELDLLTRAKSGDEAARERIVKHNLKFVVSTAKRYQHGYGHMLLVDLIQLGNMGLLKAIDRYDINSNLKLITYAVWWIRQSIMNDMDQYNAPIDFPHNFYASAAKIRDYKGRFEQEHGHEPSEEQLEEFIRPNDRKVLRYGEIYTNRFLHLDKLITNSTYGENTFVDITEDPNATLPDEGLEEDDNKVVVNRLYRALNPRERMIMEAHYGTNGATPQSTEEIGKELGMTSVRVRQIMNRAIKKMQESAVELNYHPNN